MTAELLVGAGSFITEYAVEIGLDAGREKFKDKLDSRKLKSSLSDFISAQSKYNEICSVSEEIDFEGLTAYIRDNLLDDVNIRFFDPNPKKRGQARDNIISAAIDYSHAETNEARKRVGWMVGTCIDIIRNFYKSGIGRKDYILTSEIVDAVNEGVNDSAEKVIKQIGKTEGNLSEQIADIKDILVNGPQDTLFSIDKAVDMAHNGGLSEIGDGVKMMFDHISLEHPLYPQYGYDYNNGKIKSTPLTSEAVKLNPPRVSMTGTMKIGDKYYNDPSVDPFKYSYNHQLPIVMDVSKAVKYLGNVIDPTQDEVKGIEGNTVIINPPKFPEAFACDIKVSDKVYYEHVMLRMQEIEDDGTFVIGNREQDGALYFEVRINSKNPASPDFKVQMHNASNKELLNNARFMRALSRDRNLHIYVLSEKQDIIAGHINKSDYETGFASIVEEIDFLERICEIEDYFDVVIKIDGEIRQGEYDIVVRVSDLLRNEIVAGKWTEASFTGILDEHFRQELINLDTDGAELSYVGIAAVEIFGTEFEFKYMRTFRTAKIKDFEKLKKKVAVLEDGDSIKITMIPGDNNRVEDTLHIPEKMRRGKE